MDIVHCLIWHGSEPNPNILPEFNSKFDPNMNKNKKETPIQNLIIIKQNNFRLPETDRFQSEIVQNPTGIKINYFLKELEYNIIFYVIFNLTRLYCKERKLNL